MRRGWPGLWNPSGRDEVAQALCREGMEPRHQGDLSSSFSLCLLQAAGHPRFMGSPACILRSLFQKTLL